jgi:hypothetical protein
MDFFQSHQTVGPSCYLTFFHIPERSIALVKRLAGSPKGAEIDPNLPHANKSVTQGSTRILIYMMDSFSTKLCPSCCYLYLLPYSRTFNCTKRLAGSPKGAEIDPNLPHANKSVTPSSTRILIYMDGLLFSRTNQPKLLSYLLPYILNVQLH